MSFDLRIRFAGLMMWVPQGQTAMHVLLPATEGHDHAPHADRGGIHAYEHDATRSLVGEAATRRNARPVPFRPGAAGRVRSAAGDAVAADAAARVPAHHARVMYDAAYERPGATQLSRTYVLVDLSGGVLELTGLPTDNGIHAHLPDEIPSLADVAEPVPPELVRGDLDPRLTGRVSLDAGGMTFYELSPALVLPGQETPQRMTTGTEWTIRGIRSRKDAAAGGVEFLPEQQIRGAGGTVVDRIPELYPIADTINLMVLYAEAEQFPPKGPLFDLEAEKDDPHFGAFFGISPARAETDFVARKGTGLPVVARGKKPLPGPEIPGSICVQSQNVLAPSS